MQWVVGNLSPGVKWLELESGTSSVLTVVGVLFEHCGKRLLALSYLSVHLSVCLSAWESSACPEEILMKFHV